MANVYLFNLMVAMACAYALIRGGPPERVAALITLAGVAAAIGSSIAGFHHYGGVEFDLLWQDIAVLIAFQVLALFADRFWTLWIAGLQLATVGAHITKAIAPDILPLGYAVGIKSWAYLIVILLAVGTYRHSQRERAVGHEAGWTYVRHRLERG